MFFIIVRFLLNAYITQTKPPSMFYKLMTLVVFLFLVSGAIAQELIDPDDLPAVEDYVFVQTNADADTVILALHGGPTAYLGTGSFFYFEAIPTFSVVEMAKSEMLNDVLFDENLTVEEGVAVNDTTAALIEKAVQFYKEQGKVVVLIGHSWGAIILGEYLDDYGISSPHRVIPMEGRLNMQLEFIEYLEDGFLPTFNSQDQSLELTSAQNFYEQQLLNLAIAAFENRWVDSLANMDMSKMMFTYAENDVQTGALVQEEIDFINESGAQLLFIPAAGHGSSFDINNQEIIVDFIREEMFSNTQDINQTVNDLILFPSLALSQITILPSESGSLFIYDFTGKIMLQKEIANGKQELDISHFSTGHYVTIIHHPDGSRSKARFQKAH